MVVRVVRSKVVTVLATLVALGSFACGGGTKTEAKGPEANPWADYKGTYATAGTPHEAKAKPEAAAKSEAPAAPKEAKPEKTDDATAAAPAKKPSKGTIHGESVSSIGLDAFASTAPLPAPIR